MTAEATLQNCPNVLKLLLGFGPESLRPWSSSARCAARLVRDSTQGSRQKFFFKYGPKSSSWTFLGGWGDARLQLSRSLES